MTLPLIVAAVLAAALGGYWLGRRRPLSTLDNWVWRHDPAPRSPGWWAREAYCAVCLACRPLLTWRAIRNRRAATVPRSPAIRVAAPDYDPTWTKPTSPEETR